MTGFQLVFRRGGERDQSEYRYNNAAGERHINGKLITTARGTSSAMWDCSSAATTQATAWPASSARWIAEPTTWPPPRHSTLCRRDAPSLGEGRPGTKPSFLVSRRCAGVNGRGR
jgi:hypothetical protein